MAQSGEHERLPPVVFRWNCVPSDRRPMKNTQSRLCPWVLRARRRIVAIPQIVVDGEVAYLPFHLDTDSFYGLIEEIRQLILNFLRLNGSHQFTFCRVRVVSVEAPTSTK